MASFFRVFLSFRFFFFLWYAKLCKVVIFMIFGKLCADMNIWINIVGNLHLQYNLKLFIFFFLPKLKFSSYKPNFYNNLLNEQFVYYIKKNQQEIILCILKIISYFAHFSLFILILLSLSYIKSSYMVFLCCFIKYYHVWKLQKQKKTLRLLPLFFAVFLI